MAIDRQTTLVGGALVATVSAALWCVGVAADARAEARRAADDLATTRGLRAAITAARGATPVAREGELRATDVSRAIDAALAAAGVDASSLARVAQAPPVRVGATSYQERPTQLTLRDVTLAQALKFALAVRAGEGGLSVRALRLAPVKPAADHDAWTADVTISYLMYAPAGPSGPVANAEDR